MCSIWWKEMRNECKLKAKAKNENHFEILCISFLLFFLSLFLFHYYSDDSEYLKANVYYLQYLSFCFYLDSGFPVKLFFEQFANKINNMNNTSSFFPERMRSCITKSFCREFRHILVFTIYFFEWLNASLWLYLLLNFNI